jgi:hypothetical protein
LQNEPKFNNTQVFINKQLMDILMLKTASKTNPLGGGNAFTTAFTDSTDKEGRFPIRAIRAIRGEASEKNSEKGVDIPLGVM